MGTSGHMVFTIGGIPRTQYVHNDAYPEGLGVNVLKWLRKNADKPGVDGRVRALRQVEPSVLPTDKQVAALAPYTDLGVSERSTSDWYCLLRETQGRPGRTLKAGYVLDQDYGTDGYRYVMNFDTRVFKTVIGGNEVSWPFHILPIKAAYLKAFADDDDDFDFDEYDEHKDEIDNE